MNHRLRLLSLLSCMVVALLCSPAWAELKLPQVFGDHMVLQREQPIPVWGWADPGVKVTVKLGDASASAKADEHGDWRVDLPAQQANAKPQAMAVTAGEESVTLQDVLIGDNWICSGQSNMAWTMAGNVTGADEALAAADYPQIRFYKARNAIAASPQSDGPGEWLVCTPSTAKRFSAVGFYFGRMVHHEVGVPVGLLAISWGGQRIEPFTPRVGFTKVPELQRFYNRVVNADPTSAKGKPAYEAYLKRLDAWLEQAKSDLAAGKGVRPQPNPPGNLNSSSPSAIYHAMVHPVVPFGLKGVIWYQGESNVGDSVAYYRKTRALLEGWREVFENPDLPFYWVQLANFLQPNTKPEGGGGWADLREAQLHALDLPHTGMAVAIDIGEADDIHPRNKKDVGERLAQWALHQTYGQTDRVPSGPIYASHSIEGDKIRVQFKHVGSGLMVGKKDGLAPTQEVKGGQLASFAIQDKEGQWHWAHAKIDGDSIVAWADGVDQPQALRYAYAVNPAKANLYNREGLPASPFRTDHPYDKSAGE